MTRRIAIFPDTRPEMYDAFVEIVASSNASQVGLGDAEALLWADPGRADLFPEAIAEAPGLDWIQLPYAGIETFVDHLDANRLWTSGKGVYAEPVAEHAIGLALAGMRNLHNYARATSWTDPVGRNLLGANVTILGAGGITESLLRLLEPWGCTTTVVRRRSGPVDMADFTVTIENIHNAVATADVVVVALALTSETIGLIDADCLAAMKSTAWLVNVGRGAHVVTEDLVEALSKGTIGGAALDVTDPEPLPAGHRLWSLPNCIVTPHIANTPEMGLALLIDRVAENVRRFCAGEQLLGLIDVESGY